MLIYKVTDALEKHHVSYAIAGGFAVALHGAVRGTLDVDIILKLNEEDYKNAEKALTALGMKPRLPVTAAEIFNFRDEYIQKRNLIAWSFFHPERPSEIVDIVITHDLKKMKIKHICAEGRTLCILAKKDLIAMKKESGRPQDLEDIQALEAL